MVTTICCDKRRREQLIEMSSKLNDIDYEYVLDTFDIDEWEVIIHNYWIKNKYITTRALKLHKKLKLEIGIVIFPVINRTYAGKWLKSGGAFIWTAYDSEGEEIGSCDSVNECVKSTNKLNVSYDRKDIEIVAEIRKDK